MAANDLATVSAAVVACRRCPRLVAYGREVAERKRAAYADERYWAQPVPGFGDPRARLVIVGLAPGAHGAHRTGRVFTGDRSGDFLYAALWRAGFANRPLSRRPGDGLRLRDAYITAAVRCAPPANLPSRVEFERCRPHLQAELAALARARVFLALGGLAYRELGRALIASGRADGASRFRFAHGAALPLPGGAWAMAGYHPSQQNTFTGRLTAPMMDRLLAAARARLAPPRG